MRMRAPTNLIYLSGRHEGGRSRRLERRWLGALPQTVAIVGLVFLLFVGTTAPSQTQSHGRTVRADAGMVVSAHSIWVDPQSGVYVGVADERRGGAAVGVHSAED